MKKYIWCWSYGDGCSINTADSLKNIVETYVKAHYYDSDSIAIKATSERIKVEIIYDQLKTAYDIDETEDAVCEFLQELAFSMHTEEHFSIKKTEILMETC